MITGILSMHISSFPCLALEHLPFADLSSFYKLYHSLPESLSPNSLRSNSSITPSLQLALCPPFRSFAENCCHHTHSLAPVSERFAIAITKRRDHSADGGGDHRSLHTSSFRSLSLALHRHPILHFFCLFVSRRLAGTPRFIYYFVSFCLVSFSGVFFAKYFLCSLLLFFSSHSWFLTLYLRFTCLFLLPLLVSYAISTVYLFVSLSSPLSLHSIRFDTHPSRRWHPSVRACRWLCSDGGGGFIGGFLLSLVHTRTESARS